MDKLIVYKDNYLIEASYKLTLAEQRLMLYCIGRLNPNKPDQKQTIVVDNFLKQFPDIDKKNAYQQLKKAIDDIAERWIKVRDPNRTKEFRWIQSKEYFSDRGSAIIEFSNSVMPYLCQLEQQFTQYQLRNVSSFKRTYSIRLYELLTQYRSLKMRKITITELRSLLLLEKKYPQFKELKKQVLEPSIKEINEKSDLRIKYSLERSGRSFESIIFHIIVNEQIDMFEQQENNKKRINELKTKLKR